MKALEILKNRKTAIAVTAVVIVLSMLLGMRLTMSRKSTKLDKLFAENADGSGFGVGYYLDKVDESAGKLLNAAKSVEGTAGASGRLQDARAEYAAAKTSGQKYDAYQNICDSAAELAEAMKAAPLSPAQSGNVDDYYTNGIRQYAGNISTQAVVYNESADEYNDCLKKFPISLFRYMLGIREAQRFA